ncbi:MAG: M13 family metallopeptidase, partial [Bacteroidales bacterium]|nr:M13 family metallopeptidase [Bacteroidales bacterium]
MKKTILTITAMAMIATGCHKKAELTSGINLDNLDTTVSPLDDFYQYACGGWLKNNPLDAEHSRYGSFDFLAEENQKQLKGIIDSVSANHNQPGSIADKIATLYNIGMDSVRLQQQGAEPLKTFLDEINAIKTRDDINDEIIKMHKRGNHVLFAVFGEADKDDAKQCIAWAYQSGLGLGDRDYYLTNEGNNAAIRDGYLKLMTTQFANAGYDKLAGVSADKLAATVMALETKLAKSQYDKLTNRDPFKTFNRKTVDEAIALTGNIDWKGYFSAMGILDGIKTFNVAQPEYFAAVSDILAKEDINNLKAYFAWHEINSAASYLSDNFVNASFDFYGKLLSGREANRPRWKRVTSTVDGAMGEALGHLYVDKYFPAEAKERMKTLVDNLMTALGQRIDMATWMSDQTKANAHEKLATILVKIGYPDKWRDYSGLEIKNDSYYANIVRSNEFDMAYYMSKINKPVDRDEWQMTPQTVNAYYNPTTNEICFPAAILQPPFFQFDADDAANYGAIGVVIGHELTHGFDDQGRNYDKDGNLNDWWTEQDAANFKQNAQVLVDAFNAVKVLDDPETYANGALTL